MKTPFISLLALTAAAFTYACGGDDDDDPAAPVKIGELRTSLLAEEAVTTYDLTGATCTSDGTTGLLTANFSGANGVTMNVRVKGFSTAQTVAHTCTQDAGNTSGDTGNVLYNGCAVEITVPDPTSGANTYAMYRNAATDWEFNYTGTCTVTTAYAAPQLTVSVDCGNLIQTRIRGTARNPIDPTVTATVQEGSTARCNI